MLETHPSSELVGIGLYTPAEAGRLIGVPSAKLTRWVRGHDIQGRHYEPLWTPEIEIGDDKTYLSFRDLMEARVANVFITRGLSAQKVRLAISVARDVIGERPLSTSWLRTDGRAVFLQIAKDGEDEPQLINLFTKQLAFNAVVERTFKHVEFDGPFPTAWWPRGKRYGVLIDPLRSFGQPIETETSVPTAALAAAVEAEGSDEAAARAWCVPVQAVRRAVRFQNRLEQKLALAA